MLFKVFVALNIVKIIDQFHTAWINIWIEIIGMSVILDSLSEILYCMSRQNPSYHIAYVFDILKIVLGKDAFHSRYVENMNTKEYWQ